MWNYCNSSNNSNGFFMKEEYVLPMQNAHSGTVNLKQIILDNYLHLTIGSYTATLKHACGTK